MAVEINKLACLRISREGDETCLIVGFRVEDFNLNIYMIIKFQNCRQNPIWQPTCQKICLSRYFVDIKSEEVFQIVSFQNQEYK